MVLVVWVKLQVLSDVHGAYSLKLPIIRICHLRLVYANLSYWNWLAIPKVATMEQEYPVYPAYVHLSSPLLFPHAKNPAVMTTLTLVLVCHHFNVIYPASV